MLKKKIPGHVEVTAPDLLMFRIYSELDTVVDVGWYKDDNEKPHISSEMETGVVKRMLGKKVRLEDNGKKQSGSEKSDSCPN